MPYTTVVPSTTITAAWGNTNVRDQVITPFASAAARTSAITAPVAGMLSSLTDVNGLDYYDGTVWRPPNALFARRTVDGPGVVSSTALVDDGVLQVTVPANSTWFVNSHIIYTADTTADFKIGWSGPAGATLDWNAGGADGGVTVLSGTTWWGTDTIGTAPVVAGFGASTPGICRPSGILVVGGTSGLFKFRYAQGTSTVNGIGTKAGSALILNRVA